MKKVLVIDDEEMIRDLLVQILETAGYEVVTAEDGEHGIALLRSEHPDAVITDMIMPHGDGVETIIQIKREQPQMRVIAISGGGRFAADQVLTAADAIGADIVISKPFRGADLLRCLDSACPPSLTAVPRPDRPRRF